MHKENDDSSRHVSDRLMANKYEDEGVDVPVHFPTQDDEQAECPLDTTANESGMPDPPEDSAIRMLQGSIEALRQTNKKLLNEIAELSNEIAELKKNFCEQMNMKMELDNAQKRCDEERARFKEVYKEMKKFQAGWEKETMLPWIKCMFEFFDHVRSMSHHYQAKRPAFGATPNVYAALLQEFEKLGEKILTLLERLDIVRIDPEPGTPFDRKVQNCLETKSCADPDWNDRVCECSRVGFKYNSGPMIRPADVSVWKFNAKEAYINGGK